MCTSARKVPPQSHTWASWVAAIALAILDKSEVNAKEGLHSPCLTIWEPFHYGRKCTHQHKSMVMLGEILTEAPGSVEASYNLLVNVHGFFSVVSQKFTKKGDFSFFFLIRLRFCGLSFKG
jgi:hypothetical protein